MQKITQAHLAGLELALELAHGANANDELLEALDGALLDARFAEAAPTGPAIPVDEFIIRREDMGTGYLRLLRQDDGDMCVAVISEDGNMAGIEFCTQFSGGGRSPKVLLALYSLAQAMIEENQRLPLD